MGSQKSRKVRSVKINLKLEKLAAKYGPDVLVRYSAGTLKAGYQNVTEDSASALLWTGPCARTPKKSSLFMRAGKAGVKKVIIVCAATRIHVFSVILDRKGELMEETAKQAFHADWKELAPKVEKLCKAQKGK